jgi:hypothetical protein
MAVLRVGAVAGIPIVHELCNGIRLERRDAVDWAGTSEVSEPVVIRHELGDATTTRLRRMLDVPPWCTFHLDAAGEPAALFYGVFGEVDRLLTTVTPGNRYRVRYAAAPSEPVVALQSELTAFSFAIAARGAGLIAHACAFITASGHGVLCPGISGTGKTTLARLLRDADPTVELLTDDRAIVTLDDRGVRVWGSPWPGAGKVAGVRSAPLTTLVFIRHGPLVEQRVVTPAEAFRRIVNTLSMPLWEPARCGRALEVIDGIVSRARLIELAFPPTVDAARWVVTEADDRFAVSAA